MSEEAPEERRRPRWDKWDLAFFGFLLLLFGYVVYKTVKSLSKTITYNPTAGVYFIRTWMKRMGRYN